MDDLGATRKLLSRQMAEAIDADPLGALPTISALKRETDAYLRDAVRHAALSSSWSEIAGALGVSKQAAHQRFRSYAKDMADKMKTEHRAMSQARRTGDAGKAAQARARRDELADQLRTAAKALKDDR